MRNDAKSIVWRYLAGTSGTLVLALATIPLMRLPLERRWAELLIVGSLFLVGILSRIAGMKKFRSPKDMATFGLKNLSNWAFALAAILLIVTIYNFVYT